MRAWWLVFVVATLAFASGCRPTRAPQPLSTAIEGDWTANLVRSTLHPGFRFDAVTLRVSAAGDTLWLDASLIDASGQELRVAQNLQANEPAIAGRPASGVSLVSRWVGRHLLAGAVTDGQPIALITYALSRDGNTLAVRTSGLQNQVILFERD
jgi:hypothetical protein